MNKDFDLAFKIVIVGDEKTGKTSFLDTACEGVFVERDDSYISPMDDVMKLKQYEINDKKYKIFIMDISKKKFRTICTSPYRGSKGVLLFYDVTNLESFKNCPKWFFELERYLMEGTPIILVGNKIDLVEIDEKNRKVSYQDGKDMADQFNAGFIEISCKYNLNIDKLLVEIITIMQKKDEEYNNPNKKIGVNKNQIKEKSNKCIIN